MKQIRTIVEAQMEHAKPESFDQVYSLNASSRPKYWIAGLAITILACLVLPWTQNIRARGAVTTLQQDQRPQDLPAIIAGRIVKWNVIEGAMVKKGDTLAQLEEVKDNYLDPQLLSRTRQQVEARSSSIDFYMDKIAATDAQIQALEQTMQLKIQQLENKIGQLGLKIQSDSLELVAATIDMQIMEEQLRRQKIMRDSGLASAVQLEQRTQAFQQAAAKKLSAEVKLTNARTDLNNARLELSSARQEYAEKIFKSRADRAASQADLAYAQGDAAKLANQYSNYAIRQNYYYVIAPQDGQVTNVMKAGINEIVKEGESLLKIVPANAQHAVELFVRPVDVALLSIGQKARFQFDGFPAIVFSGWPSASYGLFEGTVIAVGNNISENGKFRVLAVEDPNGKPWPKQLKVGTGVSTIALMKDVPLWYELWRNINGFPPDYYQATPKSNEGK